MHSKIQPHILHKNLLKKKQQQPKKQFQNVYAPVAICSNFPCIILVYDLQTHITRFWMGLLIFFAVSFI